MSLLLSGLSPRMRASPSQSSTLPGVPDGPDCWLVFGFPPQGLTVKCAVTAGRAGAGRQHGALPALVGRDRVAGRAPASTPASSADACMREQAAWASIRPCVSGAASTDAQKQRGALCLPWGGRQSVEAGRGQGSSGGRQAPVGPGRAWLFRKLESARMQTGRLTSGDTPSPPWAPGSQDLFVGSR